MKRVSMRRVRAVIAGTDQHQPPASAPVVEPAVLCECCLGPGIEGALCVYSLEIDHEEHVCNCCEDCTNRCADQI